MQSVSKFLILISKVHILCHSYLCTEQLIYLRSLSAQIPQGYIPAARYTTVNDIVHFKAEGNFRTGCIHIVYAIVKLQPQKVSCLLNNFFNKEGQHDYNVTLNILIPKIHKLCMFFQRNIHSVNCIFIYRRTHIRCLVFNFPLSQ